LALLELRALTKDFGGLRAVNDLSFTVNRGDLFGLIGPNGAGKTTVFNMIAGSLKPTDGKIYFRGQDITGLKPYRVAEKGLARTFQLTAVFPEFSVIENIMMGLHCGANLGLIESLLYIPSGRHKESTMYDKAFQLLDAMGITDLKDEIASNLPHGYQRVLEITMALATKPEILLLDEPVSGMNFDECMTLMGLIRNLQENGTTIILVEHNMKVVMNFCNRIVLLNYGEKAVEGSPQEVANSEEAIKCYLGEVPNDA
jgi:branched-chain amino acid transport system ATP-binding protein